MRSASRCAHPVTGERVVLESPLPADLAAFVADARATPLPRRPRPRREPRSAARAMAERRFDLVVFDWDGTLADSTAIIARVAPAARAGTSGAPCPPTTPRATSSGSALPTRCATSRRPRTPDRLSRPLGALSQPLPRARGRHPAVRRRARAARRAARAGYRLAVATGKTRMGLDRALAFHGLHDRFDATRCADEGLPKPHPDMLLHLMDAAGRARRPRADGRRHDPRPRDGRAGGDRRRWR